MNLENLVPPPAVFVLSVAALAFYTASRAGAAAFAGLRRSGSTRPVHSRGATFAQWLPIAAVALLSLRRDPAVAVNVVFATSVACLSLVVGSILCAAPVVTLTDPSRRAWPMVLPAAVLALLAGFSGQLTPRHAAVFLVQGIVVWILWTVRDDPIDRDTRAIARRRIWMTAAMLIASLILTLVGAWLALLAVEDMTRRVPRLSGGIVGALMISPALVLPMIGSGLVAARDGQGGPVLATCAGCVLLNLCVLLPLTIFGWHVTSGRLNTPPRSLAYPMAVWRVDTVLLVMLGALLVPIASGRWKPGRAEGIGLLVVYAMYLGASAALAGR
jgi:Ca2+/Na+ antiporter